MLLLYSLVKGGQDGFAYVSFLFSLFCKEKLERVLIPLF
jgi:hypothetical protein